LSGSSKISSTSLVDLFLPVVAFGFEVADDLLDVPLKISSREKLFSLRK
jgi:hypothetical protein